MNYLNITSLLRLVAHSVRKYAFRWSASENLHMGQLLMLVLLKQRGACRQSDMARELEISPATTAITVKRMEKKGLVARVPTEKGRGHRIVLTQLGMELEERGFQQWKSLNQLITSNLTSEETKTLRRLLLKVYESFNDAEPDRFLFMQERFNNTTDLPDPTAETCLEETCCCRNKTEDHL